MKVLVEELELIEDDRGLVFEPLDTESFKLQRNGHVVISLPGVVRGNHYHRHGTEVIAVAGPALVCFREENGVRDIKVPDKKVFKFTFPPNISHAIQHIGKEAGILVAFNTVAHDPENPDTVRDI
jgi:UDP-2-acetamido-2,6-beta-L-arabino-hexul-4-ose reductase